MTRKIRPSNTPEGEPSLPMRAFKLDADYLVFDFDVRLPATAPKRISHQQLTALLTDTARERTPLIIQKFPYLTDLVFRRYEDDPLRIGIDVEAERARLGNPRELEDIEKWITKITEDLTGCILELWDHIYTIVTASRLINRHIQ